MIINFILLFLFKIIVKRVLVIEFKLLSLSLLYNCQKLILNSFYYKKINNSFLLSKKIYLKKERRVSSLFRSSNIILSLNYFFLFNWDLKNSLVNSIKVDIDNNLGERWNMDIEVLDNLIISDLWNYYDLDEIVRVQM